MNPLAFVDCETTHLSAEVGEVWEVAIIRRDPEGDAEYLWQFAPRTLDPDVHGEALRIGRFHERSVVPPGHDAAYISRAGNTPLPMGRDAAVEMVTDALRGTVLIGSNPAFDDRHLRKLLGVTSEQPWHYRTIDVATLAAGYLYGQAEQATKRTADPSRYGKVRERLGWPWRSYQASEAAGVARPTSDVAHTALGDARWARDLWDHITTADAFYTATDDQLDDMVADAMGRRGGAS